MITSPAGMWDASAATSRRSTKPGLTLGPNVDWMHHARSTFATMTCSLTAALRPAARRESWLSRGSMPVTIPMPSGSMRTVTRSPTAIGLVSSISRASRRNFPRMRALISRPSSTRTSYQLPVERITSPRVTVGAGAVSSAGGEGRASSGT